MPLTPIQTQVLKKIRQGSANDLLALLKPLLQDLGIFRPEVFLQQHRQLADRITHEVREVGWRGPNHIWNLYATYTKETGLPIEEDTALRVYVRQACLRVIGC